MRRPSFRYLASLAQESPILIHASGTQVEPAHARLYKHYWQVFSIESPWEDDEFFAQAEHLCTADMVRTTERLLAAGHACVVYGWKRPRTGPDTPWDRTHPRWKDAIFAPAWDEDTDEISIGGHK